MESPSKTCQVTAPSDLPAGYQFDATVDGKTISVTVPEGGVKEGQMFDVPYPKDDMIVEGVAVDTLAPTGRWRTDLCSCCETFCTGRFWMGCCCNGILMGQTMQRLKLNACASPGDYSNTCNIMTLITIIALLLGAFLSGSNGANLASLPITVFIIVVMTKTRMHMRRKYKIEPSCCGDSCMDDCCCSFWCTCCVSIQMSRHTHDEEKYPYDCCSKVGLAMGAPEIV